MSDSRNGRRRTPDRRGAEPASGRGPRPPIKGRRRTFDVDSAPDERQRSRREPGDPDDRGAPEWVDDGPVRKAAGDAVRRASRPEGPGRSDAGGRSRSRRSRTKRRVEDALEIDPERLANQLGEARARRTTRRLAEATEAYAEGRYDDARRLLKPLADLVPDEPAIRELYGLTLYRLGRWKAAIRELRASTDRTGSSEQHPVLADCHRALGQHRAVEKLWSELGAHSPGAAAVAEGRIVYAGSLADRGKLAEAISVLEDGALGGTQLQEHHLRMRYALADLYDRAGEHQAARRHFEAVAHVDSGFFDVQSRLDQL